MHTGFRYCDTVIISKFVSIKLNSVLFCIKYFEYLSRTKITVLKSKKNKHGQTFLCAINRNQLTLCCSIKTKEEREETKKNESDRSHNRRVARKSYL